jgi:hypothetical protein
VISLVTVVQPAPAPETAQAPPHAELDSDQRVLQTVFIRSANGPSVAMRQVRLLTTVKEFREQYCLRQGQDAEACRLIFSGKELQDVLVGSGECSWWFKRLY